MRTHPIYIIFMIVNLTWSLSYFQTSNWTVFSDSLVSAGISHDVVFNLLLRCDILALASCPKIPRLLDFPLVLSSIFFISDGNIYGCHCKKVETEWCLASVVESIICQVLESEKSTKISFVIESGASMQKSLMYKNEVPWRRVFSPRPWAKYNDWVTFWRWNLYCSEVTNSFYIRRILNAAIRVILNYAE